MAKTFQSKSEERRVKAQTPETKPDPVEKPRTMTLRLKQNDFVRGQFYKAGSTHDFPYEEGKKLLQRTDKFEQS